MKSRSQFFNQNHFRASGTFWGKSIPAGTYGLFILPSEKEWKIILNKDSQNWGTVDDEKMNVAEITASVQKSTEKQEWFEIDLKPVDDHSMEMILSWENAKTTVPIKADQMDKTSRITEKLREIRTIERAGVHSGDSIAVYPPQNINEKCMQQLVDYTERLAKGLNVIGLMNIQYVLFENQVYVIEVNPRSSRTVPFLSKITDVPMANLATKAILGQKLKELGYKNGLVPEKEGVYVKVPVFSFSKLTKVDTSLGPEMKSTGEVMGKDTTLEKALYKGFVAAGRKMPLHGSILFTVADKHKEEVSEFARRFHEVGFRIWATEGTAKFFQEKGIPVKIGYKIGEEDVNLIDLIQKGKVQYVVNTTTKGKQAERDGFQIRRMSVENGVPCLTSMDTVEAILKVIESMSFKMEQM